MKRLATTLVICAVLAALATLSMKAYRFLRIDNCLDGGGRWDYVGERCDKGASTDRPPG